MENFTNLTDGNGIFDVFIEFKENILCILGQGQHLSKQNMEWFIDYIHPITQDSHISIPSPGIHGTINLILIVLLVSATESDINS